MSKQNSLYVRWIFGTGIYMGLNKLPEYKEGKEGEKVAILGAGYVGLVSGVGFAYHGNKVTVTDVVKDKVDLINKGKAPFYEPGLDDLLSKLVKEKLLSASNDIEREVKDAKYIFICVGTPMKEDGSINLEYIRSASISIGKGMKGSKDYKVIVAKSTIIPTTTEKVIIPIIEEESGKKAGKDFGVCMNPEFLAEGNALNGALNPDRIVIGAYDKKSAEYLQKLYKPFECPKLCVDLRAAEMIKYASNSFLATKISFSNEIANICEKYGVDVYQVMEGVGLDYRINPRFLRAGLGFGGSCFPKDVSALVHAAEEVGVNPKILNAVLEVNSHQPSRAVELAESVLGNLKGKRIAILGLSFKPETDDVRFTRALPIIELLTRKGAVSVAYDPKAINNFKEYTKDKKLNIKYAKSVIEALKDADGVIIQNEWSEFKNLTAKDFNGMKTKVVIDGRRILDGTALEKKGIIYRGIGWKDNKELIYATLK